MRYKKINFNESVSYKSLKLLDDIENIIEQHFNRSEENSVCIKNIADDKDFLKLDIEILVLTDKEILRIMDYFSANQYNKPL
ncbi:MAG: hypothetical protein JEZ08_11910 [Clostridiales bacterium]|nr:hypothetical protein [Clostridiales bacterium]